MRRRTSSADQCTVRSAATARRAPANVPSEFGARSQVWPLSRCVWTSIRHGQTWPRRRSTLGSEASGTDAGGSTAAMRASRMTTSTTASPSGDSDTPGGRSVRNAAGTVALRSRYALCSGTVTKSSAAPGELTIALQDRKSTRLNSSHLVISYAVFCLKKKKKQKISTHRRPYDEKHCPYAENILSANCHTSMRLGKDVTGSYSSVKR